VRKIVSDNVDQLLPSIVEAIFIVHDEEALDELKHLCSWLHQGGFLKKRHKRRHILDRTGRCTDPGERIQYDL